MSKNHQFFLNHFIEHAASQAEVSVASFKKVATLASFVGGFTYKDCLQRLANDPEATKKLVNLFGEEVDPDESSEEGNDSVVDEGHYNMHDTIEMSTQHHPREFSGVNPYSPFSASEGFLG